MTADRPVAGPPRPWSFPAVDRLTIDTGLRLAVVDLPGRAMAAVRLVFGAGGTTEDEATAGAGLLAARGLSEGTEVRSGAELAVAIEALGADIGAEVRWDAFVVRLDVPASHLAAALELLGEVVRRPAFPDEELGRLRQERLDQLAQERHDPGSTAGNAFDRAVWAPGSAYAHRLGGDEASIAGLSRDAVAERYHRTLEAGAPTLVVAGHLEGTDVASVAERALGHWTSAGQVPREAPVVAADEGGRRVVIVDRPGSVQSALAIGHTGPRRKIPDYVPLVLMSTCLGGVFGSRLNYRLREKHGYTYGAFSSFDLRRDGGVFNARTAVETSVTAPALVAAVEEIERMHTSGIEEDELAPVRDYRVGVFPIAYETPAAVAAGLVELQSQDLPDDHPTVVRETMRATDAAEVTKAAADHIRPDDLTIVVVGDGEAVSSEVEAAGLGEIVPDPLIARS